MAASSDLYDLLATFLGVCAAALLDTPDGPPDACAIYLSPGVPAWDVMPSLIVHCGGPAVADTFPLQPMLAPGHRVAVQGEVSLVSVTATVLRCAPVLGEAGELPPPAEFAAITLQTTSDLWAIQEHLRLAKRNGVFGGKDREFLFDPAVAVNQQGGACGWQITCRIALDGYTPTAP